jgi:DNA modification methylase
VSKLSDFLFHQEPGITLYCGDCREVLPLLEGRVMCCVTSPPYWGLRDYGTATWKGGDSSCPHRVPATGSTMNKGNNNHEGTPFAGDCGICGARRIDSQLGLESTPEQYVAQMVAVFREVRRVLHDEGTLWLNLGDSYCSSPAGNKPGEYSTSSLTNPWRHDEVRGRGARQVGDTKNPNANIPALGPNRFALSGLKPKDLIGVPWRVAFALQADGWYLRSDIIWAKPNPMPESVTDRPTKAHEYLFLMSKSERYYYDAEAIQEPAVIHETRARILGRGQQDYSAASAGPNGSPQRDNSGGFPWHGNGRNRRSVWTIATEPFPEAHFATFPTDLIKPCIMAGSPLACTVLDSFAGAGTTLHVAKELNRQAIGIELNPKYCEIAVKRLRQEVLPL